ncbi:MFS transporter [Luteibacter sp. PPL201]|uniref:MFS transporter n=1 Tax=Luteibacter sahnii TaxID=3021977 RepID=A0ABT6BBK2_9GAMM
MRISTASAGSSRPGSRTGGASTVVLAIAAFTIVTTEFLIIGLLPAIARDLGVSIAAAGQLVTAFALVVMVFGPVLTAWLSHRERRGLFVSILGVFAVSNAVAALAPNVWILAIGRIVPALALPVFWGTASDTAARLAGPDRAGKAVSTVYLGISAAMLFGIPIGTLASGSLGWRGAFWLLAGLSALAGLILRFAMPPQEMPSRSSLRTQAAILKDGCFVANVLLSALIFTANFTAYTYLADILERLAGVPAGHVGWWLMGFGAVGLIGNGLGGRWLDRSPLVITGIFTLVLAVGLVLTMALAQTLPGLLCGLVLWGIANTALYPICQVRVMRAAPHAQALAGTLNVSAANAGIGLGAVAGGVTITHVGQGGLGYVAAAIAVLALAAMPIVRRMRRTAA